MSAALINLIVTDFLWFLVIVGWILLVMTGLEADKPLSGGIPGHRDPHDHQYASQWDTGDRLGEVGAWAIFLTVVSLLPVTLYWIFAVHGG
ncbi:MAG: hypothetical protein H3C34_02625 [Caldilineaceae bacterium]|nr:hypothetical protein [Caldilineaceae bacterium]